MGWALTRRKYHNRPGEVLYTCVNSLCWGTLSQERNWVASPACEPGKGFTKEQHSSWLCMVSRKRQAGHSREYMYLFISVPEHIIHRSDKGDVWGQVMSPYVSLSSAWGKGSLFLWATWTFFLQWLFCWPQFPKKQHPLTSPVSLSREAINLYFKEKTSHQTCHFPLVLECLLRARHLLGF